MAQKHREADSYYNDPSGPQPMQYQEPQQPYQQAPPIIHQITTLDHHNRRPITRTASKRLNRPSSLISPSTMICGPFILTVLGFAAISGISLQGYSANKQSSGNGIYHNDNNFSLNTNTIVLFVFVLCVALVFSWSYFLLARMFTKQFIWITGILQIVFGIGTAVYYLIKHYYSAGIVFALFAIFSIICFVSWIPRIPFSVAMLQQTMDIARSFGHVFLVSAIGGIASVAFGAWFSVTLVAIYVKYEPSGGGQNPACSAGSGSSGAGGCSSAKVIGLIVFVTFAGYWITEWLKNTMHSIVAGVYGSWFFCAGKPGGMPSGATRGAARRSLTYSFGSISLGSLVVALINMVRQACSIAQRQEASEGNMVASILFCLLGCIIGIIDWAVQFINRYAFSHIALYGKAYIPAAKDTWTMMKNRGVDALVNDCLISPVLTMGATFVGYLCALLAFLYLQFTNPEYNKGGEFTPVVMAFSFLIGLQVCQIFMTPLGSGVDTIFVAMAWDPDVLMRDHPDFYNRVIGVYPKVQQYIHA
ncbi:putative choline transporter, neither null mutation nor overexpression affects choline transport [Bacidia gigantensis]|uniref:putative choline transporter, neither null mutation nor overexpression affects choline transport n=1 Tax=Bacidia gigantensis TaxID=2732470 RepID=UPI001D055668|nr:putative choline transporter, neither null mutation nor overexpression affects choline transport [Bacidia gigantensis]KAG8531677.1 putative choline transporter, neither null mutation nor overexpression affects choline transport [Bacidia gigantensis]